MTGLMIAWVLAQANTSPHVCEPRAVVQADRARVCVDLGHGRAAAAVLAVGELPADYPYRDALSWGWDAETAAPKTPVRIIRSLHLTAAEKEIPVPLSAYSDLCNPREISVERLSPTSLRVSIVGGDAGAAYRAVLDFRSGEIVKRRLIDLEFSDSSWEETTYSFFRGEN